MILQRAYCLIGVIPLMSLSSAVADLSLPDVDLAASNHKGGLGHIPTDTTGFGVRYTLNLLLQQSVMDNQWN